MLNRHLATNGINFRYIASKWCPLLMSIAHIWLYRPVKSNQKSRLVHKPVITLSMDTSCVWLSAYAIKSAWVLVWAMWDFAKTAIYVCDPAWEMGTKRTCLHNITYLLFGKRYWRSVSCIMFPKHWCISGEHFVKIPCLCKKLLNFKL